MPDDAPTTLDDLLACLRTFDYDVTLRPAGREWCAASEGRLAWGPDREAAVRTLMRSLGFTLL